MHLSNPAEVPNNPPQRADARQPAVLIVDDDTMSRMLLSFLVSELGYDVQTAVGGAEALEVYERGGIDLVLLDVVMPGLDGPHTLDLLRAGDPEVCCCFATAGSATYSDTDLRERGAAWVFKKPLAPAELGQVLRRLVVSRPALCPTKTGATTG